eukprot:TRINITY_DN1669_c0_g2_i1.p1 TRINITY_DN1669_c0_g2~~TRINITY_DN1669_c0_g2_i1.p1  ORF type:complete len:324 (-),score=123.07 TRINITY_DN1669_c0_g2_i1:82-1053(-)
MYNGGYPPNQQQGYGSPVPGPQQGQNYVDPNQGYYSPPPQQFGAPTGYQQPNPYPTSPSMGYNQQPYPGQSPFPVQGGHQQRDHHLPEWMAATQNSVPKEQMWQWFSQVDTNRSGTICAQELATALSYSGKNFPFETVQNMIEMFDTDGSGDIDFEEFGGLYNYITQMENAYRQQDPYGQGIDERQAEMALGSHSAIQESGANRGLGQHVPQFVQNHKKLTIAAFIGVAIVAGIALTRMEKNRRAKARMQQISNQPNNQGGYNQQGGYNPYNQQGGYNQGGYNQGGNQFGGNNNQGGNQGSSGFSMDNMSAGGIMSALLSKLK